MQQADHSGHRQRMKERAMKEGLMSFQPHEFLEILLYPFIPYKDTNELAHKLLDEFGSLEAVFEVGYDNLMKVKGMTKSACFYISLMPEMFRKYNLCKLDKKPIIDTTDKIIEHISPFLNTLTKEAVYMMCLDSKGALLGIKCVATGVVNEAYLHIRDIVEEAIRRNAVSVIIAHNHPSGDPHPSPADIDMTEDVDTALKSIGIELLDHVIICTNKYYSFRRHGGFELMYRDYMATSSDKPHLYKNDEYDELFDVSGLDIDYGDGT